MPVVTGRARLGADIFLAASEMKEAGATKASREDSLS